MTCRSKKGDIMTKTQVSVVITTQGNYSVTADDATVAGQGTAAYTALENHRDVVVKGEEDIKVIPFDAIDHAVVTLTSATVDDPTDEMCNE